MNTAQKRLSVLDWDQPFQPAVPMPSGSDTAGKRQHGMWTYSGIESTAAVGFPGQLCARLFASPLLEADLYASPRADATLSASPLLEADLQVGCC